MSAPAPGRTRKQQAAKRTRAQKFLIYVNMFTALVGLVFLFASFYARGQVTDNGWSSVVARNVAWVGVFASLLTILVSFIGCFAAQTGHRNILFCYVAAFTFILGCQIAAAVTMSNYSQQLQITNPNLPSGALTLYGDIMINNDVFSVYQKCCTGCPMPNPVNPLANCNNTWAGSWDNQTNANCLGQQCTFVGGACTSSSQTTCFNFNQWPSDTPAVIPTVAIDLSLCTGLQKLTWGGKPLVGPVSNGVSCGNGNPTVFLSNLSGYVKSTLYGVAVVYIIIAFFEALILPVGLYVLCCMPRGGGLLKGEDEVEIV